MFLKDLLSDKTCFINIDNSYEIPKDYYKDTEIIDLTKIDVKGNITYPSNEELLLNVDVKGTMKISDSVTLDPINYEFSFKIEENVYEKIEKDQFSLDIIEVLWENIVLEIPIRYSEVKDYKDLKGDGWKVISEDDIKEETNNPFKELLDKIEKE